MDQQQPLVCPSHTTQYVGALIIGVLVGAGASFVYFKQSSQNTYQAGFDDAKKRVLESPISGVFRTPDVMLSISGSVTAVDGNRFTIHTQVVDPFADKSLDDRTVTITADTKISKLFQKDPKAFQVEMDAFIKKMQTSRGTPQAATPPEPVFRTPATAQDIIVGDTISVTATENIKTSKEFTATEMSIQAKLKQ